MLISSLTASADLLRHSPNLMTAYVRRVSECKLLGSVKYCADSGSQNKWIMLMHQIKMVKLIKRGNSQSHFYNWSALLWFYSLPENLLHFLSCCCCFPFQEQKTCHHKLFAELQKKKNRYCCVFWGDYCINPEYRAICLSQPWDIMQRENGGLAFRNISKTTTMCECLVHFLLTKVQISS